MSSHVSQGSVNRWQLVGLVIAAVFAAALVWWLMQHSTSPTPTPDETQTSVPLAVSSVANEAPLPEPVATVMELPDAEVNSNQAPAVTEQLAIVEDVAPRPETNDDQLTLTNSDPKIARQFAEELPSNPLPLLTDEYMVRKFVRAVNALADGNLVSQYRPFVPPQSTFRSAPLTEDTWRIDESNYARYTPYIDLLEKIGPEKLVALHRQYLPLMEQAFRELGSEKPNYETALRAALQELSSPSKTGFVPVLVRPSVMFKFQDKQLESLPAVQKLLLRMGPDNQYRLQRLCQKVLESLK